jgi:hypothetical protein
MFGKGPRVLMKSLYAQYVLEREDQETLENEFGFLTYRALPSKEAPQEFRIFDLYVIPEKRKSGVASSLADQVVLLAKGSGCHILTGSVDTHARGATESVKVLLAYGFQVLRTDGPMIYFKRELAHG